MAAIAIDSADVAIGDGNFRGGAVTAGETLVAGDFVYRASDGKAYKTDPSDPTKVRILGMMIEGGAADATLSYVSHGPVVIDLTGTPMTIYTYYVLHPTLGKIGPIADLTSGDAVVFAGYAQSALEFFVNPVYSELTKA